MRVIFYCQLSFLASCRITGGGGGGGGVFVTNNKILICLLVDSFLYRGDIRYKVHGGI